MAGWPGRTGVSGSGAWIRAWPPRPSRRWARGRRSTGRAASRCPRYSSSGRQAERQDHGPDEPNDKAGKPKTCTACKGDDKDKPIVGLVIVKDLTPDGDRYKGGTILDPEDGKVYKAELWTEDGKLKVRGYLGVFYKTQTWVKGN